MKKKDLVIGKKYLHKNNMEVYYLGESKNGYSIVQPTNGIHGMLELKVHYPEIKDIVGNDRFWGYYNMHLELKEIEPKHLTINELIDGEIYEYGENIIVKYPSGANINPKNNTFEEGYDWMWNLKIREANQEQKDWLNKCIKADKFVPKDYVEEIPEYVECISELDGAEVGKIYKVINDREVLCDKGRIYYFRTNQFIPSNREAFEAQNKAKENTFEVGKWSVGSYVVPLQDKLLTRSEPLIKGKPYQIIRYSSIPYIICEKGTEINFNEYSDGEEREGIKWFATLEEAQEFSNSLKNKQNMNYKFKVGDKVKVVKTGYGIGNIVDYPLTITSLGTYTGEPGYSVEPKIGNCLSGVCNGMIGEKSFELYEEKPMQGKRWVSLKDWEAETRKLNLDVYDLADYINGDKVSGEIYNILPGELSNEKASLLISKWDKEEEWTPQIGDWVVIENWDYATIELNQVCQILTVEEDCPMPYEILLNKDQYGKKNSWHFKKSNFRKALPHEIPNQDNPGVGSEVFNIDFNEVKVGHCDTFMGMKIYGHIAYQPLQPQYQWSLHNYSPKNDGLDLSLRDEKEVNVNEIKSSNNNISKLNLSLNN